MFSRSVGALHLLLHVVNLQSQDAETVDGPGWTFGVDGSIVLTLHAVELGVEVTVNLLYQVGTVLIALVDATLERQCIHGIDVLIADDVLQMPLHGVNPAFLVQIVFDGTALIGVLDGCIYVVRLVIIIDYRAEDRVGKFCKFHNSFIFSANLGILSELPNHFRHQYPCRPAFLLFRMQLLAQKTETFSWES